MGETQSWKFVIEQGVPAPVRQVHTVGLTPTLRRMQPGESVLVPGGGRKSAPSLASRMRSEGYRFTVRAEGDGLRIWCVERPAGATP